MKWQDSSGRDHINTLGDLLAVAEADPFFPYPLPLLRSIFADSKRPTEGVSATSLVGKKCLRCQLLQKYTDYSESVEGMLSRWRGTLTHAALDPYLPDGAVGEVRYWVHVDGVGWLHGKPDFLWYSRQTILDWKTAKQVPYRGDPWAEHGHQLQVYRWLVNHATHVHGDNDRDKELLSPQHGSAYEAAKAEYKHLGLYYLAPDAIKPMEVRKSRQVETKPGAKFPTKTVKEPDVWTDGEVEAFLFPRAEKLLAAYDQYEKTGKLPAYPQGMDLINSFEHKYSATATACVESYVAGN